ncbi:MAG: hypothetical protein J7L47_01315 [Candidatus Odinarchaeota archaeon]|nr:hypothetical protein [Candidatus Odinarchaeota archaeon]
MFFECGGYVALGEEDIEVLELKRMKRKGFLYGSTFILLGLISLLAILVIQPPYIEVVYFVFIACLSMFIIGVFYVVYVGDAAKSLLRSVEIIKQIEPDELIVTKAFVLGRKGDIYLITKRTTYMLSLLKFSNLVETNERKIKIKIPKIKFLWNSKKIAGVNIYYSRSRCTIPVSKDKYATGNAVGYFIDIEHSILPYLRTNPPPYLELTKDTLLAIINALRSETV